MKKIMHIAPNERPRERLIANGPNQLSDIELLAVMLGSGSRECGVMSLAAKTLDILDSKNGNLAPSDLLSLRGLGHARTAQIMAALEFSRRRIKPEGVKIRQPTDVLPLVQHLNDRKQEHFICVSLNGANEVLATRIVTVGLANAAQIHPREVFSDPISDRACSVIVAHNHPSGDVTPSREDMDVTTRLKEAGSTLGIKCLIISFLAAEVTTAFRNRGRWAHKALRQKKK
jgi:DNA repair protein RadC